MTNALPSTSTAGPSTAKNLLNKKKSANNEKQGSQTSRGHYPRDESGKIIRPTSTTSGKNHKTKSK